MAVGVDASAVATLNRYSLLRPDRRMLHVYGSVGPDDVAALMATDEEPVLTQLHRRLDPLTGEWIAFSPARNQRPNQPRLDSADDGVACPLCPGGPEVPFAYDLAVFDNRYPSLLLEPPAVPDELAGREDATIDAVSRSSGRCEVVLYAPAHQGSLATLHPQELINLVAVWRDRSRALWADQRHAYVFTFENRGEEIGATLLHPHGQIYAFPELPPRMVARNRVVSAHRQAHRSCLMCDVVSAADADGTRQLAENASFSVAVPFAPRWPYEVHVRARGHGMRRLEDLTDAAVTDLAQALQGVVHRYDALYGEPLAYMMAVHEAPRDQADWHLSFEFYPPSRSPGISKVRASVETAMGFFINDTIPESSARHLRADPLPGQDWSSVSVPRVVASEPHERSHEHRSQIERTSKDEPGRGEHE